MPELSDQIVLVTGATSGIGEVTARELARRGAQVVLLARSADKAAATQARIEAAVPGAQVDVLLADLADFEQVRRAAAEFNARYPRLDVLINNAGLLPPDERRRTPQGLDFSLATNHLGPFLLTSLLIDRLRQSPAARVINVSSALHQQARPDFGDFQHERHYDTTLAYANAKLYNIMFTQELARRLRAHGIDNVVTNALHPGVVATAFGAGGKSMMARVLPLIRPFLSTPEQGAATTLFLATDPAAGRSSGGYYAKQRTQAVKNPFNTPENARRLWQLSEELTGTTLLSD
ncbi:SDR family oxidoreductase [Hymenobacter jeollabukensis]|uniref:SDR family oxidoreductase n=1 Tax=Hymenobacter jeollabukensis TaxID=2025313 RepID=A0A5R8WYC1_9BACT|nr:SDR family oxidoreductase [Hymenobacter jeollabukensis]TLM97033.1 SDR family oxidoreductase [Hymenobacter jeollabukensis]